MALYIYHKMLIYVNISASRCGGGQEGAPSVAPRGSEGHQVGHPGAARRGNLLGYG